MTLQTPWPAASNAMVSIDLALAFLDQKNPNQEQKDLVQRIINDVSTWIESYCERPMVEQAFTNLRLRGHEDQKLYLKATPIESVQSLAVDEVVKTVWSQETDGAPANFDTIISSDPFEKPWDQRNHLYTSQPMGWFPFGPLQINLAYPYPVWGVDVFQHPPNPYNILISYTGGYNPLPNDLTRAALILIQKFYRDQTKTTTEIGSLSLPSGGSFTVIDQLMPKTVREVLDQYHRRRI